MTIRTANDGSTILQVNGVDKLTVREDGAVEAEYFKTPGGVLRGIASTAQAQALTDDEHALTPAKLGDVTATESRRGIIEIATTAEAQALTDDQRALTPKKLGDVTATQARRGVIRIATTDEARAMANDEGALTPWRLGEAFRWPNQSIGGNGYQRLPGGLIIQWGSTTASDFTVINSAGTGHAAYQGSFYATFPIAFPTARLCEIASCHSTLQPGAWGVATAFTASSSNTAISGPVLAMFNPEGAITIKWFAIGY